MKIVSRFKAYFKSFFEPRFSTLEFEQSTLRKGGEGHFEVLFYDDFLHSYPNRVKGFIYFQGKKITCEWDKYGRCSVEGNRRKDFDLMRPPKVQKEIDASRNVFISLIFLGLTLTYLIFQS
jgi:hypothetical protein